MGIVSQLAQPTGDNRCTHTVVIEHHHPRLAHTDIQVGGLDQLAARRVLRARQAAKAKLLGAAYIAEEQTALTRLRPGRDLRRRHRRHLGTSGQRTGCLALLLDTGGRQPVSVASGTAMLELKVGQKPTLGTVFQRIDRILHSEVDQRLGPDNAAGTPSAVDHDRRRFVGYQVMQAITQLAIRAADRARNGHLAVFVERTTVQQHQGFAPGLPIGQFGRTDMRRMAGFFHQFAKGLGRHMHAGEQPQARRLPAVGTALQNMHLLIAQRLQALRGTGSQFTALLVVDHQPDSQLGRQASGFQFQAAIGQMHPVKQMGLTVLAVFTHIEQGDFTPVEQPLLQLRRCNGFTHTNPVFQ